MTSCLSLDSTVPDLTCGENVLVFTMDLLLPFQLQIRAPGRGDDFEIVPIFVEKVMLREELRPPGLPKNYLLNGFGT